MAGKGINEMAKGEGMTEGLFESVDAALRFAYNFQGSPALSVVNQMANKPGPMGKGLGGLDGAAQAGIIRRKVASLGKLHESIIIAEYAQRSRLCPCCSGPTFNQEWKDAIGYIADIVRTEALNDHRTTHPVRRACVEKFFGLKIPAVRISEQLGVDEDTIGKMIGKVRKYLTAEHNKAMNEIESSLIEVISNKL